jgi:hypothetical protein
MGDKDRHGSDSLQRRKEYWVIADLVGKGGHVRMVPVPAWVKATVDTSFSAAKTAHGRVFLAINKAGPGECRSAACDHRLASAQSRPRSCAAGFDVGRETADTRNGAPIENWGTPVPSSCPGERKTSGLLELRSDAPSDLRGQVRETQEPQ